MFHLWAYRTTNRNIYCRKYENTTSCKLGKHLESSLLWVVTRLTLIVRYRCLDSLLVSSSRVKQSLADGTYRLSRNVGNYLPILRKIPEERRAQLHRGGDLKSNKRLVGRDSSAGIATRYGPDGPGIEYRWGARFLAPVQPAPGAHLASHTIGTGSFPGVKRPGRGADHPPPSSAEVEGRVELYVCSPSGPS